MKSTILVKGGCVVDPDTRTEGVRDLLIENGTIAEVSDEKYDTDLTKMAEGATEKGVNEISAGEKNLDDEFSKDEHGITTDSPKTPAVAQQRTGGKNTNKNAKRNQARKNKKKNRQNKKRGRS